MKLFRVVRLIPDYGKLAASKARSKDWEEISTKFLSAHPECECCGAPSEIAHHILPFSEHPELELDEMNLGAVCVRHCCHLMWGHLGCYRSYNPAFREDAAHMLAKIKSRPD